MPEAQAQTATILALVTDLIFSSRITGAAKAAGATVRILRKPEQLVDADGDLLLADLNLDGATQAAANWAKVTSPAKGAADAQERPRRVVGFVSHVDSAAIAAAREAGIQEIVARSRFIQMLPELLRA
jgi:hypothetical protein